MIGLLQRTIQFRSYSAGGEEGPLARYLAEYLSTEGLAVELQEVTPGRLNVVARLKGSGGGPTLMYNGHIDTNPVGLGWTVDPLAGLVRDGCIYGIGVSNMKASNAAFIEAVQAIRRAGIRLKGDVVVGLVVGELQGGIGTLHLLRSGVGADWFINGEPTDVSVLTLHAGAVEVQIDVYGVTRHMSKAEQGVNAIEQAMKVLAGLKTVTFSGADRPEYAALNRYNVGVIRGGLGTEYHEWRIPQLPDLCTIKIALRYGPRQSPESMLHDIQGFLDRLSAADPNFRASARLLLDESRPRMDAFEADPTWPVVQAVAAAHERVTGTKPRLGDVAPYKYYGSDAAHLLQHGIRGVVYGCGGKYNTMPDERVELADIQTAARVYALSILEVCGEA